MSRHQFDDIKKSWSASLVLVAMIMAYTFIIGNWAVNRFMSFNATLWDLGLMTQAIWNTAHGKILYESVNLGYSVSRLAVAHWELIYLPLAIIYRIIPSVPSLLYIQTFVLACGVIPIYKFAQKKLLSETTSLLVASAYLFYPALHGTNLFDLHGLTFATTFLLFTFYFLDQDRFSLALIFGFLSLSCREDVTFVLFVLGLYSVIFKKNKKTGLVFLIASVGWFTAFIYRAYFWGSTEILSTANAGSYWDHLGEGGIFKVFTSLFKHPWPVIQQLIQFENLKYLAKLLIPVLGMSLLAPGILLIAAPTLLLNLLSNWQQMHQIEYHYTATITPFIFLAAIKGIANIKQWISRFPKLNTSRIPFVFGLLILATSIISTTQFSILRFHKTWYVSESNKKLVTQLQEMPPDLSVSTTARAGAHLAKRQELYHFPEHCSDADIIIVELNRPEVEIKNITGKLRTLKIAALNELTESVFQDTTLGLRFVEDNVFCFQRGLPRRESFEAYAFRDEMPSNVTETKKIVLGNGLYFLGWKPVYIGDKQAHFQLYWLINKQQPGEGKLKFFISSGDSKIKINYAPLLGRIAIHEWTPGKIICDHLFINRPAVEDSVTISVLASISGAGNTGEQKLFTFEFR